MEFCQMIVQGLWNYDSVLKQIPHFNDAIIKRCQEKGVETVFDVIELEEEDRDKLLNLSEKQMQDVARFCNRYPNVELNFEVEDPDDLQTGESIVVNVTVERAEDDEGGTVIAPLYPQKKDEGSFSFFLFFL